MCFDCDRFGVFGYFILKFFLKNNKDGEDYDGGWDLNLFVEFLNKKVGIFCIFFGVLSDDVCLFL